MGSLRDAGAGHALNLDKHVTFHFIYFHFEILNGLLKSLGVEYMKLDIYSPNPNPETYEVLNSKINAEMLNIKQK